MKTTAIILVILLILIPLIPKPVEVCDYTDYGTLTAAEQGVFRDILTAVERGESIVYCDTAPDIHRLATHLAMHYGDLNSAASLCVTVNGNIYLNLSQFDTLTESQQRLTEAVRAALAHIRNGSDRFKLWQVSRYIAKHYAYSEDFVCADYAVLFYHIASRLGIETYICFGCAENYHAWNMVLLDEKPYYYDLTFYDGTRSIGYLHSSDQWGRVSALNDIWAGTNTKQAVSAYGH